MVFNTDRGSQFTRGFRRLFVSHRPFDKQPFLGLVARRAFAGGAHGQHYAGADKLIAEAEAEGVRLAP